MTIYEYTIFKKELSDFVSDSSGDFLETKKQVINVINEILGGN